MRLADEDRRAAGLVVEAGERPGAINEPLAALNDEVRIGAVHRQAASREPLEQRAGGRFPASR